jgi:hypothetical protein
MWLGVRPIGAARRSHGNGSSRPPGSILRNIRTQTFSIRAAGNVAMQSLQIVDIDALPGMLGAVANRNAPTVEPSASNVLMQAMHWRELACLFRSQ